MTFLQETSPSQPPGNTPLIAVLKETGEVILSDKERFWLPIVTTEGAWADHPSRFPVADSLHDCGPEILRKALRRFLREEIVGQ